MGMNKTLTIVITVAVVVLAILALKKIVEVHPTHSREKPTPISATPTTSRLKLNANGGLRPIRIQKPTQSSPSKPKDRDSDIRIGF